jgi:hypothetical protein
MSRDPKIPIAILFGENRLFGGNSLFVDLVPSSSWTNNVRSLVSPANWQRIRVFVSERANRTCEICHSRPSRLDAHERWSYDETTSIQKLERIICLCPLCHIATHYGRARIAGQQDRADAQLMRINGWDAPQLHAHVSDAFRIWTLRSAMPWTLDVSIVASAVPMKSRDGRTS